MSSPHYDPLDEGLVISILTPLMTYADVLAETRNGESQSRLLWVLLNDVKKKMEYAFDAVNAQAPGINVEISHVQ